jgi:hypothetical protein
MVFKSNTLPKVIRKKTIQIIQILDFFHVMKILTSVSWKKDPQRWATAIAMHGATEKSNSCNTQVNGRASRIPEADDMMRSWSLKAVFDTWNRMKNRLNQRRTRRLAILQSIESLCVGPHQ